MIKVAYDKKYNHICITGHDKATICASVSSIVQCSANLAIEFNNGVKYEDDGFSVDIYNVTEDDLVVRKEVVTKVLENMINCLKDLERQYPDSIEVEER